MLQHMHIDHFPQMQGFHRLPTFLFQDAQFTRCSNHAKLMYALILSRADLSRKNNWADEFDRVYLYYPIDEVTGALHCGRQKAVATLRELQHAGLIAVKKQGCGKPNKIYPTWYEPG